MGSFNRDNRSGGDRGGRGFGRKGSSFGGNKKFGSRDNGGKPAFLYDATCAKCGKACQVPFKPTGERPVFCRDCFDKPTAGNQTRSIANSGFDRPRFEDKPRFDDKQMFEAICAKCGNKCQVPFRPIDGKPVFCSNCFDKKVPAAGNQDQFKEQFAALNSKLDAILKALSPARVAPAAAPVATPIAEKKVVKAVKEVKATKKAKDTSTKVKTVKKPVTKKKK